MTAARKPEPPGEPKSLTLLERLLRENILDAALYDDAVQETREWEAEAFSVDAVAMVVRDVLPGARNAGGQMMPSSRDLLANDIAAAVLALIRRRVGGAE